MKFLAVLRYRMVFLTQFGLASCGLAAVYLVPPPSGQMLLVPVTHEGRAALASVAVAHGARLVSAGPINGSLLVDGMRDRLVRPLLQAGIVTLSARAGGCGA